MSSINKPLYFNRRRATIRNPSKQYKMAFDMAADGATTICLFDVDGTLTTPRQVSILEKSRFLQWLLVRRPYPDYSCWTASTAVHIRMCRCWRSCRRGRYVHVMSDDVTIIGLRQLASSAIFASFHCFWIRNEHFILVINMKHTHVGMLEKKILSIQANSKFTGNDRPWPPLYDPFKFTSWSPWRQ